MSQVDEGLIHAWLDGQLPPDEAARIEHLAATDPAWSAAIAEARGYVAGASRILGALDDVPAVLQRPASQKQTRRSVWWRAPMMSAAAAVLLVVSVSNMLWRREPQTTPTPAAVTARPSSSTTSEAVASAPPVVEQSVRPQADAQSRASGTRGALPTTPVSAPAIAPTIAPPAPVTASANTATTAAATGATTSGATGGTTGATTAAAAASEVASRPVAVGVAAGRGIGRATDASLADRRDAGVAQQFAAKSVATPDYVDPVLAGCWETIDNAPTDGAVARERAQPLARAGALIRFTSPAVTDVVRSMVAPPSAAAIAQVTPGVALQNAVARRLNDSTFVTEWFRSTGREQVTFTVHADTLRGRVIRNGATTLPGAPFLAIRRACAP